MVKTKGGHKLYFPKFVKVKVFNRRIDITRNKISKSAKVPLGFVFHRKFKGACLADSEFLKQSGSFYVYIHKSGKYLVTSVKSVKAYLKWVKPRIKKKYPKIAKKLGLT